MPATFLYEAPFVEIRSVEPAFGVTAGGSTVAIIGRGFAVGISVDFGGSAATGVVVESSERLTAVTPAHAAGEVDVTVTNVDATTDTLENSFTYQNAPGDYDISYRRLDGSVSRSIRYENAPPSIRKQMGQPDSMSFTANDEPAGLEFVQFRVFGVQLFIGTAVRISERIEGRPFVSCWDTEGLGLEHELSGEHPVGKYLKSSGTSVLQSLITTYAPGFSYAGVESDLPAVTIWFDGSKDLWTAIMEVCDQCGAKCFMAGTVLYAFTDDPGYDPPDPVTPTNPYLIWPDQGDPVTIEYDYSQIVNDVTARGAEGLEARRQNPESIRLYRKRRGWINNNDLTTTAELGAAAQRAVDNGSEPIPIVRYSTRDLKTDRGKKVTIAMDQPAIDGDWIIDAVSIDQLELADHADTIPLENVDARRRRQPRFKVTAKPATVSMRQRRMSSVAGVIQETIDISAVAKMSPKLTGDIISDPGGKTTIPAESITAEQLAGCIPSDKLEDTGVTPGTYGSASEIPRFTVDESGRITDAGTVSAGPEYKDDARVATTANLAALSGLLTIDGVTLIAGDRVLVKNQTAAEDNGIYVAASGAWSRAADADTSEEVAAGLSIEVTEGTTGAGWYTLATNNPIDLGTTALTFVSFGGGGGGGTGDIKSDGSVPFAADQSMGGNKLTDVDDPDADEDAANKRYVDAQVSTSSQFSILTNGDPVSPELIFDSNGDVIVTMGP